jgi:hypothetical protein
VNLSNNVLIPALMTDFNEEDCDEFNSENIMLPDN